MHNRYLRKSVYFEFSPASALRKKLAKSDVTRNFSLSQLYKNKQYISFFSEQNYRNTQNNKIKSFIKS